MTMTPSNELQDSSSLMEMEKSDTSNSTIELGKKLVSELGLEQSTDTLSRWMAHHIAGLIQKADNAPMESKAQVEEECFKAILNLWAHHSEFPEGKRPFQEIEPILKQLHKLDPGGDNTFYYGHINPNEDQDPDNRELKIWLDLINGINYSAKLIISYSLSKAAELVSDKTKEWVSLAEKIDPNQLEVMTIRFTSDTSDLYSEKNLDDVRREVIQGRIDRLDGVIAVCETIKSELARILDEPSSKT